MKILNKIWGVSLLALLLIIAVPKITKAQDEALSEQDFYDALAPYGTWVNDATYGDVWLPDVDEGFMPYQTNGYWAMTNYGNTWVSNYEWGWAAFHYGMWRFDDYYGWEWIPGYDWSPAWVVWRSGNGYYGWAPVSPDANLSASIGGAGYDDYWAFAPAGDMYSPSLFSFFLPRTRVRTVFRNTAVINNTFVYNGRSYAGGPHSSEIARYTHHRPTIYQLNDVNRPGSITVGATAVNIFRPRISRTPNARPQQLVDGKTYQQQNPNQRIGDRTSLTFSRTNAQKLVQAARNSHPTNNTGFGGGAVAPNQSVTRPAQPTQAAPAKPQPVVTNPQTPVTTAPVQRGSANTQQQNTAPPRGSGNVYQQQQNQTTPIQQNSTTTTPSQNLERQPHHGRPENRPNIAPANMQQNGQAVQQQQAAQQPQRQQQTANQQAGQQPAQQQQQQTQQATQQVQQQHRAQFDQQRQQHQQQLQATQQAQQQQASQQAQQQQTQQRQQQQAAQQAQQRQQQQAQQQAAQQQQAQQRQQQQAQQQAAQQAQQQKQQQAAQQAQQAQQRQQQQAQQQAQRQAQQQAQQQKQQQQAQQQQERRPPPPEKKP